jgi:hypothetical protein
MTTSANRLQEAIREKVETLFGDRGNPDNHAVRVKDLAGLNNALGGLLKTAGSLASSINGAQSGLANTIANLTALGNLISSIQADVTTLQTNQATDEANIATLQTGVADLQSKVDAAHAVSVPSITSAHAAADPPTKAEFDKVVDDLNALRGAITAIVAAL